MFQNIGFTKKRKIADIGEFKEGAGIREIKEFREFREGADIKEIKEFREGTGNPPNFPKFSIFLKLLTNAEVPSPLPKIGPLYYWAIC